MKQTLLLTTTSLFLALAFMNNSSGPTNAGLGDKTGSPLSSGTCASCHSGGAGITGMSLILIDGVTNIPVTNNQYVPSRLYNVQLLGSSTANLPKFGFQLTALKSTNNTMAGAFSTSAANCAIKTNNSVNYLEHIAPLSQTGGSYQVDFSWVAPGAGSGMVKFYGVLNAVDGTGGTYGDKTSPTYMLTLNEATNSIAAFQSSLGGSLTPNPAQSHTTLNFSPETRGAIFITVYDLTGKIVLQTLKYVTEEKQVNLECANWPSGAYFVSLQHEANRMVLPLIKR